MTRIALMGVYQEAKLCVGWLLKAEDIEDWMSAHEVRMDDLLDVDNLEEGDYDEEPLLKYSQSSFEWVGLDGTRDVLPPDWYVDNANPDKNPYSSDRIWFLNWRCANNFDGYLWHQQLFLNTTDLTALLADTDSLERGAALAAEMGNTGPLIVTALPHYPNPLDFWDWQNVR